MFLEALIIICAILNIAATVCYFVERKKGNRSLLPVLGRTAAGFSFSEVLLLVIIVLQV